MPRVSEKASWQRSGGKVERISYVRTGAGEKAYILLGFGNVRSRRAESRPLGLRRLQQSIARCSVRQRAAEPGRQHIRAADRGGGRARTLLRGCGPRSSRFRCGASATTSIGIALLNVSPRKSVNRSQRYRTGATVSLADRYIGEGDQDERGRKAAPSTSPALLAPVEPGVSCVYGLGGGLALLEVGDPVSEL
jgi:hypothetical protein